MIDSHNLFLLVAALVSVIGLIMMIAVVKLNPVITLFITALALAIVTGMPLTTLIKSFETGVGGTLGHIAIIVALGTMLGKMMAESGAADRIAYTLVRVFGEKNVPWAMVVIALMVAGLSVVHGLVPPHPAAMLAVTTYHADVGRTILYGLLIGTPTAIIAGPLYAKLIAPHIRLADVNPMAEQLTSHEDGKHLPGFWLSVATIILPVMLMVVGSWADTFAAAGSALNSALRLIGNDDMALLIGVLMSFVTLGTMRGFSRATVLRFSNECLAPTAAITLLIGAGGGFGRVLQDCGVSAAIIDVALKSHVPILLLAWLLAAAMRLATGSSTVAMATAANIVAPIALHSVGVHPELLAIATGAGSLIFSHVNDGGFWLVKEYFNMTVVQTMKTWSVSETIVSVTALGFTAIAWHFA